MNLPQSRKALRGLASLAIWPKDRGFCSCLSEMLKAKNRTPVAMRVMAWATKVPLMDHSPMRPPIR